MPKTLPPRPSPVPPRKDLPTATSYLAALPSPRPLLNVERRHRRRRQHLRRVRRRVAAGVAVVVVAVVTVDTVVVAMVVACVLVGDVGRCHFRKSPATESRNLRIFNKQRAGAVTESPNPNHATQQKPKEKVTPETFCPPSRLPRSKKQRATLTRNAPQLPKTTPTTTISHLTPPWPAMDCPPPPHTPLPPRLRARYCIDIDVVAIVVACVVVGGAIRPLFWEPKTRAQ